MGRDVSFLEYSVAFFLAFIVGTQGWTLALTLWEPFSYRSVVPITLQVKAGENFIEQLQVDRNRICRVDIDRFMIHVGIDANDPKRGQVIYRAREPGGATELGHNSALNMIKVPPDAPRGHTCMIQSSSSQCIDGLHTLPWPRVCFEITD